MVRVNNVSLLDPQQIGAIIRLQNINQAISQSNLRIATQKRINAAKDDPAGLVSVSNLQSELEALEVTSKSLSRASAILDSADSTAGEIVTQLQAARAAVLAAADGSLSGAEVAGKQAELDSSLRAVSTLAATQLNGQRLLDGSSGFRVTGLNTTQFKEVAVLDRQTTGTVSVSVNVTTQATKASNAYTGGTLAGDVTLNVTGSNGTATVSLSSGATTDDIASAFNAVSYLTGVTASKFDASRVNFSSVDYGTAAQITIETIDGTFAPTTSGTVAGTNAVATINGQSVTAQGTTFTVNTQQSLLSISVAAAASGTLTSFSVSGEGLQFQVGTSVAATARLGLPNLNAGALNGIHGTLSSVMSTGDHSLTSGNLATTLAIVDHALQTAVATQARIGGFQKSTLDSSTAVISSTQEHLATALADRDGFDLATETSLLAKNQLLQQATVQSLQVFQQSAQSIFTLLSSAVAMM